MRPILLLFFLSALLLYSCNKKPRLSELGGNTMGTTYSVKYINKKDNDSSDIHKGIEDLLLEVNRQMSTYIEDSDISKFNKLSKGEWFKLHAWFFEVLSHSLELAELTEGVYDPTIGPLVNLWGFGPTGKRKVPSHKMLAEVKKRVGYKLIKLNREKRRIKKIKDGVYLDLSASAKGFGVDIISQYLEDKGINNYMVEIGGELRTKGSKGLNSWKIGIERPNKDRSSSQLILNLNLAAVATSGTYRNFFTENHKKYSHTLDYKTGRPIDHGLISVSVIHSKSCMKSDAWATALMALGQKKGLELAEKQQVAAYFISAATGHGDGSFAIKWTKPFEPYLGGEK
jgi:thiamine biosynthesis lipoprotein